ncbi:hypothetical protein HDV00_003192 [Rhizophlyctis rosea]|nr:hypothetical protein HDV00_003192 [Rhizophlyctis rosea]
MASSSLEEYLKTLPEWANDARMSSLFAAFPSDPSSNPAGYNDRLRFWESLLTMTCGKGLLGSEVLASSDESSPLHGVYAVVPLVRESGDRLLALIRQQAHYQTDYILSKEQLYEQYSKTAAPEGSTSPLSPLDLDILLRYLAKRLDIVVSAHADDETLEIVKVRSTKQSQSQSLVITQTDRGIVTIKITAQRLNAQVEQLETKITELTRQAQERIRHKQKERALYSIRQKKTISEVLKKRLGSLETIEAILHKIQSAETDAEIFSAYNVGADTLKNVLATSGLTVQVVEDTMDKLQDALADQKEIDDAMVAGHEAMAATSGVDDSELEQELDALLLQDLEQLPSVANIPLPAVTSAEEVKLKEPANPAPGTTFSTNKANDAALDAELDALEEELADKVGSLSLSQHGKESSSRRDGAMGRKDGDLVPA